MRSFFEFFAGGGMARVGLGPGWRCLLANDIDPRKAAVYRANWGEVGLRIGDVALLSSQDAPGRADLAWASFPCQDLSLAGRGSGMSAARSGAFWPFYDLMAGLAAEGRAPRMIAIENVCGLLTSQGGRDFQALLTALTALDYDVGAVVADAAWFVPQSRPRLFVFAAPPGVTAPGLAKESDHPTPSIWAPPSLTRAVDAFPSALRARWRWLTPASPPSPDARPRLIDLLETPPQSGWRTAAQTQRFLALMNAQHRDRVDRARRDRGRWVGAAFRRTRPGPDGGRVQRVEVRFDGVAGCLRTPSGGSSRQILIDVDAGRVRTRLFTPREAARLMGLPDTFLLPPGATDAYHLTGDGVVAPVVRHLAASLIEPLLEIAETSRQSAWPLRAEAARGRATRGGDVEALTTP